MGNDWLVVLTSQILEIVKESSRYVLACFVFVTYKLTKILSHLNIISTDIKISMRVGLWGKQICTSM